MLAKLKLIKINNENILKISGYALLSVLFLIIAWLFDYRMPELKRFLPEIILLQTDVSASFLSTLAGVFLTVTTFTFTTILTVLNKYSSSFTPRIVQDFVEKPNVLSLFGILVGGFFYTVLSLFMLQNVSSDTEVFSGTLGVIYAVAAMLSFVLFVRRVLKDIKGSNVIENIYQKALTLVEAEAESRKKAERNVNRSFEEEINVYAQDTGYFYSVEIDKLMNAIKDLEGEFVISKKIGDYVPRGVYLGTLNLFSRLEIEDEEKNSILKKISESLLINVSRNEKRDYHHEITNLVEIAMTALSPGINDPNTAIICVEKISLLLGKLFSSENNFLVLASAENARIIYSAYSVKDELYLSFSQILFYAKNEPAVARTILNGIYIIYLTCDDSAAESVTDFFEYAYRVCLDSMKTSLDREYLEKIHENFSRKRDFQAEEDVIRE